MTKSEKKSFLNVAFETLGLPVFWGVAMTLGFYLLINLGLIDTKIVNRYFTGHPVVYFEAVLFFIGVAALVMKLLSVVGQFNSFSEVQIVPKPLGGQSIEDVDGMLNSLRQFPDYIRNSYLVSRLQTMLQFVQLRQSPVGIEEELKHQSELDSIRRHEGYALVRIIVWAIPMLGFLGTVIGITLSLGDLSPTALVAHPEAAMEGLLAGLSIAFDTTALALTLSIILMFGQFVTNRLETDLLEAVDTNVEYELAGRFAQPDAVEATHPQIADVSHLSKVVMKSVENMMKQQTHVWNESVRSNEVRWTDVIQAAGSNIQANMTSAFRQSMRDHTEELDRAESNSLARTERQWDKFQHVLTENAKVMQSQQAELVKQGDLMLQAINATGEVSKVQNALNDNLKSLTMMGQFDETIMSLSAAINLLNARLGAEVREATQLRVHGGDDYRRAA